MNPPDDNFDLGLLASIELDKRKIHQLLDDGVITAEELANATVVEVQVTPGCQCGFALCLDDELPHCPVCGVPAIIEDKE